LGRSIAPISYLLIKKISLHTSNTSTIIIIATFEIKSKALFEFFNNKLVSTNKNMIKYIIMYTGNTKKHAFWLFFIAALFPLKINALDSRNIPVEVNLIMDGSRGMKNAWEEAANQVGSYLADQILQEGDRLTIWDAGARARIIYSETLKGGEFREEIKALLKSRVPEGPAADFAGALREAAARNSGGKMTYTMLVSGSSAGLSSALAEGGANLLKYSRVRDFPSWKILIVALDINSRVREAAAAYMSGF
jgi:hypothetical protein